MGVYVAKTLDFREDLWNILKKVHWTISLSRKLQNNLPRALLMTIYKFFIRPHLDYEDILHHETFNNSFHKKLELIQYNAAFAITDAIRGSYREKRYQELGFESLQQQWWYRKLCLFFKIWKSNLACASLNQYELLDKHISQEKKRYSPFQC